MARYYLTKVNDDGNPDSITSIKFGAGEFTSVASEITNAVVKSGQTPAVADGTSEIFTQIATSMFINGMGAQSFQDGGAANVYVVTPATGSGGLVVPTDYAQMNGAVISFIPANVPTGASTLDFGQTTGTLLGVKNIVDLAGDPIASGAFDTTHYHDFKYSVALNSWIFIGKKRAADPVSGLYNAYGKWSDVKASSTDGGTFTNGAWRTRDLNTEDTDSDNIGSIASDQLTLQAGTYKCLAHVPAQDVALHAARLYDTTGAAVLINGTNDRAPGNSGGYSIISGEFTLGVASALEVQHQCSSSKNTIGFGEAVAIGGRSEVYTIIEIWRVS